MVSILFLDISMKINFKKISIQFAFLNLLKIKCNATKKERLLKQEKSYKKK